VLVAHPHATDTGVSAREGGGWTVSLVTAEGHKGTVTVDKDFTVGTLVLAHAPHAPHAHHS